MIEKLKQALDALYPISHNSTDDYRGRADKAISFLLKAIAELESQELKQITVKDFVHMVEGKEDLIGRPVYFAQWPNGNTHPPQHTEQEPVAWSISPAVKGEDGRLYAYTNEKEWALSLVSKGHEIRPLVHGDINPPQRTEQELVACERCKQLEEQAYDLLGQLKVANLKLSVRSQRTWVGLTGEEAMDVTRKEGHELLDFIYEYGTGVEGVEERIVAICKAIGAKLKQKNGYAEEKNT